MADQELKVYTPQVVEETPFPQEGIVDFGTSQPSSGKGQATSYGPTTTADQTFPTKRIAVELLSSALNTRTKRILQEFQFTQTGALQIGVFETGISGDLRISPNGIVGRDATGFETIAIDATTGDVVITGTFRSRSIISGDIAVGDGNILIDGENRRMIWYDEATGLPIIVIGNVTD